jgi:dTDP-4-amino-4,6-dideoxygalactose transaminase
VIYDAAHCFGVRYKGTSIFNWGDVSTCSFHATKLFHTGEGGAMIAKDDAVNRELYYSHNFGHTGPYTFYKLGVNAKTSELQAAMGLAVLPYMERILTERRLVTEQYDANLDFSTLQRIAIRLGTEWNYSYYPVIFKSEAALLSVMEALTEEGVNTRRYFFPSLNTVAHTLGAPMPVSESIASRVLCLPLYAGLEAHDVSRIISVINKQLTSFQPGEEPETGAELHEPLAARS